MKKKLLVIFSFTCLHVSAQEPDMLEPNNRTEQAVSIDLLTSYLVSTYPEGDLDYFSFRIAKPMMIEPVSKDASGYVNWQLQDEKGNHISSYFPVLVQPGQYYLKMSGTTSPDEFMITIKCSPPVMQKTPALIESNRSYTVSLSNHLAIDSFSVKTRGSGYITLQSFQAPAGAVLFACTWKGREYRGNPLVIPVNKGSKTDARMMAGSNYKSNLAFTLYASENKTLDETEANDSIPIATSIDKSKSVFFSLYPSGDEDWFVVKTTTPGKIFADISYTFTSGSNGNSFPYRLDLYNEKKDLVCAFAYRYAGSGYIYSTTFLKETGTYYMRVSSGSRFDEEQLLTMKLYGNVSGSNTDDPFRDIYFIGFELDTSANATLQALSESQGAKLATVDSTGSLEKTMAEIFEDAKKKKTSGHLLWWVIGIGAAAAAGYWVYKKRNRA